MAEGVYELLRSIIIRSVQKEGNLPGFLIYTVCYLHFDNFSELNIIIKYLHFGLLKNTTITIYGLL